MKAQNYFKQDLGIAFEEQTSILFSDGIKSLKWGIIYASPCANITHAALFNRNKCDTKEKIYASKTAILLSTCERVFAQHIETLQQIIPRSRPTRNRRQSLMLPTIGVFADFLYSMHNNYRSSKLQSNFNNFSSWTQQKVTDLSKAIIHVSTLADHNSDTLNGFVEAVCKTLVHDENKILFYHLESILDLYYDRLMTDILSFSNDRIPLVSKFYLDLISVCTNIQSKEFNKREVHSYCVKMIRSNLLKVQYSGIEILNERIPSIKVHLNISLPLVSKNFNGYKSYKISNTGYFLNKTMFRLSLPDYFIANGNEIISLDKTCSSSVCHIKDLQFNEQGVCISNLLLNSTLKFCYAEPIFTPCLVSNLDNGLLVTASNALIVYNTHSPKNILFSSEIIFGEGRLVCDIAYNRTLSYVFNTHVDIFQSNIFLNSVTDDDYQYINISASRLDKVEISQSDISNSQIFAGTYLTVGYDVIILFVVLSIGLICALLYRSQYKRILNSFANIKAFFGAKWCLGNTNNNAISTNRIDHKDSIIISCAKPCNSNE